MANVSNKEERIDELSSEYEYEKQRLSFITDLKRFNTNRGTPFDRIPEIGGQEVDLYHLYQLVTSKGGWHKVNYEQQWEDFQAEFGLPKGCVNGAQALKNIYFRYLNLYEKVNFLGEDPDTRNNEEEEGPARKKICLPIETIPLHYNYNQHKLTDAQRQQYNLSTDLYEQSDYEKLEMSLRSGLPNEVDVAVNVCVLLSTEGKHCMKLEKTSHLMRLLLAHVGIFEEDSDDLQYLYRHCWASSENRNFLRFWFETVERKDIRTLITWLGKPYSQKELVGKEVLNLGRDLGTLDVEGQRVMQVAVFLHNLSFEDRNQKLLAGSYLVYKFLILSLHSNFGGLRQLALDTFANLSCEVELDALGTGTSNLVLDLLNNALYSEDRFFLVRGLEILSKISQLTCNEGALLEHLKEDVYARLVALLTVQDIQLIVHTLEALYKLSKIGEPFTTRIAKVHKAIDTLVSLITIEAQSFGPGSLVGIKVVEYVPPAHVTSEDGDSMRKPTTVIQPINPDSVNIYQVPASLHSQMGGALDSGSGGGGGPGGGEISKVVTPVKEPVTDIQATTSSWLNATYELKKKSKVNQVELFSDYLQFCRKFQIHNAMSSAEFLHLVKVIFHQCEVLSINRKNGDKDVFLEGLCKRPTQKPFAVTTMPPEKVRNPLSVNVSPKQTPTQVVESLAHTPTLRQRLMEPPRVSLHPQLNHSGATSSASSPLATSTPAQAFSRNSSHQTHSSQTGSIKGTSNQQGKIMKNVKSLSAPPVKRGLAYMNSASTSADNNASPIAVGNLQINQPSSQFNKGSSTQGYSQTINLATVQSFPSISHALQTEQGTNASDALSVKSLLAKKLSQGVSDQDLSLTSGTTHISCQSHKAPQSIPNIFSQASQAGSSVNTVAFSSSQATINKATRPVSSSVSSSVSQTSSTVQSSSCVTQTFNSHHYMNSAIVTNTNLQSNQQLTAQNCSNNLILQQNTNQSSNILVQQNNSTALQNPNVTFVQRTSTIPCVQNNTFSLVQQNSIQTDVPQNSNISIVSQQQPVCMQFVQPNSTNGANVSVVQQNAPCAIMPKTIGTGQMHNNSLGSINPQCFASSSLSSQPQNIQINHMIRNPSNILVTNHQTGSSNNSSNALTITSTANMLCPSVTQTISSPAVAALLTSTQQQGSQMIISSPMIAGGSVVQATQSLPVQAPTTVVIQTPPGTIVMPSRQLLVQGNGSTAFGSIQQGNHTGTVSFIVPSQYRPGSAVTVQGLNIIPQGSVNMVPSLALASTSTQSQTSSFAAQTQNIIQMTQTSQTNVNSAAANQLGSRQIVLAQNQATIPVGVPLGNFVRNSSNICLASQQQQQHSFVIQSSSTQPIHQSSATSVGLTMNLAQSQPNVQAINIPTQLTESHIRSDLNYQQPQQQNINLNISSSVVTDTLLQQQQNVLSTQCNGLTHEVNGFLGSPESVCSDFPPSPLSTGINSDKDIHNGKVLEIDKDVLKKSDIGKVVEKTSKLNGYVHLVENPNFDIGKSDQTIESDSLVTKTNSLSTDSQGNILINGCLPGVIQGSSIIGHQTNFSGVSSNSNNMNITNNNGVQQTQYVVQQPGGNILTHTVSHAQHQPNNLQVQLAQQHVQLQFPQQQHHLQFQQPVQIHQSQGNQVVSTQHQALPPQQQRQIQHVSISQQTGNVQQKPKISTLSSQASINMSQSGSTPLRQVFNCDISKDSDTSNDSVISSSDPADKIISAVQTPTSKKTQKSKPEVIMVKEILPPRQKKKGVGEVVTITNSTAAPGQTQKSVQIPLEYMCEWANCRRCFSSSRLVFLHVFKYHIPKLAESSCQWTSCEKLVRKRWSLVSHVQDHHCSEMAMRTACQRRFTAHQQQAKGSTPAPTPAPHQPMIYPPDAAMQAIRRFSIKQPYAEFTEQREGPVSKHIRLTAALILRNICHFSSTGRRAIRRHEQQLSYNTMNAVEASTALSHCLWEIIQCCEQKPASFKL
ncbi:unnamed protein product [Lymnaea stagnalis]|uniref:ARID domain-containing protein n=1 Tax=Lymnaea stagnalis TaxID=6523 RepID=A0AAV2I7S3_LYMST